MSDGLHDFFRSDRVSERGQNLSVAGVSPSHGHSSPRRGRGGPRPRSPHTRRQNHLALKGFAMLCYVRRQYCNTFEATASRYEHTRRLATQKKSATSVPPYSVALRAFLCMHKYLSHVCQLRVRTHLFVDGELRVLYQPHPHALLPSGN